ncbi:PAXNEB-domain-containing protein [Piedraia hortae CBS 480.64]|uniref:Elongator complex protein 4 n=1 Tax=Piedraia hortae CBS 480.64 TaxID=1314780 RepID=A0A6A7C8E8_9PEZI|nr:PAXNEB-domain-containing protein [Piedraia hortae CBS 480.64]
MAFRKRNIAIGRTSEAPTPTPSVTNLQILGSRPSPVTSHLVTSTGTPSVDEILGGHTGLALGSSLLIEESGTTDYSGALTKYFGAEGIVQGHVLHVVGVGEGWVQMLPGLSEHNPQPPTTRTSEDRMKIAWRYEKLETTERKPKPSFSHTFDLTKRITLPPSSKINHIPISPTGNPFSSILPSLEESLRTNPNTIHRLVIPSLLSPGTWPCQSSEPTNLLQFLHTLRQLLKRQPQRIVAMMTLPLELYPRSSGLVRWAEILSDGVLELTPFPRPVVHARTKDDELQGMIKVLKLPIITERGEGGAGPGNSIGDDLAFTVSRRRFVIKPFSLPPLEGEGEEGKKDLEF